MKPESKVIPLAVRGHPGAEPGPYDDEDPPSWQRVATLVDGTRVLITVWDNDPDTIEVLTRELGGPGWSPPYPITTPH